MLARCEISVAASNNFHGNRAIVKRIVGADLRVCPENKGELQPCRGRFWQRNYYEHIIRDEDDLIKIREYIQNSPLKWHVDIENPIDKPQDDIIW